MEIKILISKTEFGVNYSGQGPLPCQNELNLFMDALYNHWKKWNSGKKDEPVEQSPEEPLAELALQEKAVGDFKKAQENTDIKAKQHLATSHKKTGKPPSDPAGTSEKICMRCQKTKPLDAFTKKEGGRLGRTHICKECNRELYLVNTKDKVKQRYSSKHSKTMEPILKQEQQPENKSGNAPVTPAPIKTIKEKKHSPDDMKQAHRIILEKFKELGINGIYSKDLLPGFSLTEIRQCCIDLKLLDVYGNQRAES